MPNFKDKTREILAILVIQTDSPDSFNNKGERVYTCLDCEPHNKFIIKEKK